jgi:hypothetical protein
MALAGEVVMTCATAEAIANTSGAHTTKVLSTRVFFSSFVAWILALPICIDYVPRPLTHSNALFRILIRYAPRPRKQTLFLYGRTPDPLGCSRHQIRPRSCYLLTDNLATANEPSRHGITRERFSIPVTR